MAEQPEDDLMINVSSDDARPSGIAAVLEAHAEALRELSNAETYDFNLRVKERDAGQGDE